MDIAILDSQKAYLPEIEAYIHYLSSNGVNAKRITEQDLENIEQYDIVWKFAGVDRVKHKNVCVIHEYNSLAIGKLGLFKDQLKKYMNTRPNGRVFLNDEVKKAFHFTDGLPSINRDMGIAKNFFISNQKKEYDFVYVGAMDESRQLDKLLHAFCSSDTQKTILMIGRPNDSIHNTFKGEKNIIFTGAVSYKEVPQLASKAIYGMNYIPNIHPYNEQTSTKLLEYCALGLRIVTTDYRWVKQFEKRENAQFYRLADDFSSIDFKSIEDFEYITPDVDKYEWEIILEKSNILEFIKEISM